MVTAGGQPPLVDVLLALTPKTIAAVAISQLESTFTFTQEQPWAQRGFGMKGMDGQDGDQSKAGICTFQGAQYYISVPQGSGSMHKKDCTRAAQPKVNRNAPYPKHRLLLYSDAGRLRQLALSITSF